MRTVILGIESSCDETAAAVLIDGEIRSNVIASQEVHAKWGGVVPELASRAHQEHIVPVVQEALVEAGVDRRELDAIAFTQGPGLIGALLVGTCFARSMSQALQVPLLAVNHVQAHVMAHFIRTGASHRSPAFPFLNLTVSGGHTQLVLVRSPLEMEIIGTTLDDAAGEAFDKGAKVLGLPYPGGPLVDRHAEMGDPHRYVLPKPALPGLDLSFSGIKTAFVALVLKGEQRSPGFAVMERDHLCASLQSAITDHLMAKTRRALREHALQRLGIAGGVAANRGLRERAIALGERENVEVFIPPPVFCTDNAAMIAMAGLHLWEAKIFAPLDVIPMARAF